MPPRDDPVELRSPTPAEVARPLAFVAGDSPLHLYLTLAATTGARRGQLLALRWNDVDFIGGTCRCSVRWSRDPKVSCWCQRKPDVSYRVALDNTTLELSRKVPGTRRYRIGTRRIGRPICLQLRPRRSASLVAELRNQAIHPGASSVRSQSLQASRPAAFHGHADARCRGTHSRRLGSAVPRQGSVNHPQRVCACCSGCRSQCSRNALDPARGCIAGSEAASRDAQGGVRQATSEPRESRPRLRRGARCRQQSPWSYVHLRGDGALALGRRWMQHQRRNSVPALMSPSEPVLQPG